MRYAELHMHDIYSALDGTSTPEDYMVRAKEIGITHLAQTNHGTLSGHRHWQRAAKEAGIIPILGEEGYFTTDRFDRTTAAKRQDGDSIYNHITLLAQNDKGLRNLQRLNEIAWSEGFYHKSRIDLDVLEEYNEGLIVLSGCRGGVLAKAIENGLHSYADQMAGEFKRIFGERYFIEVMSHNPLEMNKGLLTIGQHHNIKTVVTSDCHHARKEDLWVQEAMLILSTNPKAAKDFDFNKSQKMEILERYNYLYPERKMTFQDINIHLNSVDEHLAGLKKHGIGQEAIDNTMVVANMIDSDSYPYHAGLDLLPKTTEGDVDELLESKVFAGLKRLGKDKDPVYVDRANHELKVIKDKGFSAYFHIALKAVLWAKKQGIRVGPGRGSGAGSLVCYAIGLTGVDPIVHKLIFERFIDPSRSGINYEYSPVLDDYVS
jgi:DNA polymerase-3 subunit alpha